jgi:predicted ATPase
MPRDDPLGFARQAVRIACADLAAAPEGVVFFDRGLVDAVAAVAHLTGTLPPEAEGLNARYAQTVFLVPPWPEIYGQDAARRHAFTAAAAEYERLRAFYPRFGYRPVILPRVPVAARVALVLDRLGL